MTISVTMIGTTDLLPNRLISVHFPKAAGTSLLRQLTELLPDQVHLDYAHDPLVESGNEVAVFPDDKRVVHGHFKPQRYSQRDAILITFLRHPVSNVISIFYYWLDCPEHGNPVHTKFLVERPDIFQFAAWPEFSGLMSKVYFVGFDMARFDFIGFHSSYAEDVARLGTLLGLPLSADIFENKGRPCEEREPLEASSSAISRLTDLLVDDVRFYNSARARF